jgi:putative Ca2+/H+ antiporter (TMEM165/GDT1 family)
MVLANAPVIWFGEHVLKRVPLRAVRIAAAVIFGVLGTGVLLFGLPQF